MSSSTGTARRNLRQYRGRVVALGLAVVVGSVVAMVSVGLVARAAESVQESIREGVALRTVNVRSTPDRPEIKALRAENLAEIARSQHVTAVEPWLQASFGIKTVGIGGVLLYATTPRSSALPPLLAATRTPLFPLRPGEVVVPDVSQGMDLSGLVGETVTVSYTQRIGQDSGTGAVDDVTVVGTFDHSFAQDGPAAAYAHPDLVIRWAAARAGVPAGDYLSQVGYSEAFVVVDEANHVTGLVEALRAGGYNAGSLQELLTSLPAELRALRILGIATFVMLLIYGALSGVAISSSFMRHRTREIGLMNALGFRRARILRILLLELVIAGGVAGILGAGLGTVVTIAAGSILGGRELVGVTLPAGVALPDWRWIALILAAPVITLVVGGLLPARRAARLQPDLALRDAG